MCVYHHPEFHSPQPLTVEPSDPLPEPYGLLGKLEPTHGRVKILRAQDMFGVPAQEECHFPERLAGQQAGS